MHCHPKGLFSNCHGFIAAERTAKTAMSKTKGKQMCRPCGARLPSLPHLNTSQEAALSPSFCRVVPRRTILMNDASQEKRPPMRETVRDIDRQILSLLLQRHNVLVRMMRGSNRLTPQDERFLRESWEGQASKISSDPLLTSRLFNLLQEVDFLPPPSEENQTRRTAFNLAPQQKPVNIDMEGPRDQHATQVWIAIAAMTGKPLQIGKALVNDAVSDCVHMFNLMGANLHRDGNVIRHGTDCTPAGTPDKVLHVGKNPFNFYLGLAHYIGRPGHTRFSGGTELRLANFTPLRHFLPELGSRIIPLVPKTEGLPLRVECSGLLPDTIVLPADLPAEFMEALIIAAPFYGRQIVIDLGALDAGARSSMLSFLLPILSMAGCEIREEGSRLHIAPWEGTLPAEPEIAMDPGLSALVLSLAPVLGGTISLRGLWPAGVETRAVEALLGQLNLSLTADASRVRLEAGSKYELPDVTLTVPENLPQSLATLPFALACAQALKHGHATVPQNIDPEIAREGESFSRACGLKILNTEISPLEHEGEHGPLWTAPSPAWAHALALCACVRHNQGFSLNNPSILTELYPGFWPMYNGLPIPALKRIQEAEATKERRRIRTRVEAKLTPRNEDDE